MSKFEFANAEFKARHVSSLNMNGLATWCGGKHFGIKLPVESQCIKINTQWGEADAYIGDWIIEHYALGYFPVNQTTFHKMVHGS